MKNRHNFEFSPKTMLVLLTIICILLLSVSAVLKDAVKPLSAVAETVVIPMQDGINSFGVWVGDHVGSFKSMKELKKENAKLNQKVIELTQENETLSTNEKELNNLQELLKMDKAYSQYKKVWLLSCSHASYTQTGSTQNLLYPEAPVVLWMELLLARHSNHFGRHQL